MERFAKRAAQALGTALGTPVNASDLELPPDPKMGDFGFPCFKLSKQFRKSPPQVAQEIVQKMRDAGAVPPGLEVAAVGPYVNFTVPPREAMVVLGELISGPGNGNYGSLPAGSRGSWVLEFSSPNVAKTLNIYHLRPTALGAALDRIGRYRGFKVTSINHLGDWGKQYGMLVVAFRLFGKTLEDRMDMRDLVDLYVRVNAEAEKDPKLEDEAREAFLKLERGDPQVTALWEKCKEVSLEEFDRVYARLGVKFDHIWGESFYKDRLQPLIADLKKRGLLVESEGAWVVPVTDEAGKELPPCILVKSDGATIYATRDVAAAIYRFERFAFDRMTYIVGGEQRLHFQQVFSVLRRMELAWASRCEHVPTGLYRFKDAKMSTRKGNFITLEEVLDLAKERVRELVAARATKARAEADAEAGAMTAAQSQKLDAASPAQLEELCEKVAVGAVVFHDLATDPARDVEFDVERVVDFEGETGPYLQYAHTRCVSILRKARETERLEWSRAGAEIPFSAAAAARLVAPEELALVKQLGQLSMHLERALSHGKASQLCNYLIDVTRVFGAFYRECRVLGEDAELTHARLMLVEATRRVLARGLELLGIPLPERM
jgi:arginyl-tRNA synthetase